MSPVHLRNLGFQRNQPEDRGGLSRTRRPGGRHLGHRKPKTRGLEGYGSSCSAPPTPQRPFSMEHGQKEVQTSITLGRTWSKLPEDMSQRAGLQRPYGNNQRLESHKAVQTPGGEGKQVKGESSHYASHGRTAGPDRAYSDSLRSPRSRPNQISNGFKTFRNHQISGQESPFFTIPGSFQEKTRIQGQKQDLFQPKAEQVRPNDPEAVGLGERSTQEAEIAVHTSRISSPINRNITPTQIEHNVVTPESNLNIDALWLQMSQFAENTQKQFSELQASNEKMKTLTDSMDKIVKTLQEGHAQTRKSFEKTNKRLNQAFEEQHHRKRDRDCLDKDINKLFNVYHNMKPQPKGHAMDNPYHQEEIKPEAMLVNTERSQSQYQDGYNLSCSEKEALKQLPEASSWPKFSGKGEYDHMEISDYVDGIFIDVPSIPDYWITSRLNTALKGHAGIWYTEMKEIHGWRNWPWWKSQIIQKDINSTWIWQKTMSFENDKYSVDKNPYDWCLRKSKRHKAIDPQMNIQMRNHKILEQMKRTNIGKHSPYISSGFKEKQPFRVEFKDKPRERVAEVAKKKNYCNNCGSTDHYANTGPKAKNKVYAIEKVPEEESPTEESEADSMGDAIREQSDEDQDPREEFLVEYQEETPLQIQDIHLEAGIPQETANKNLCKHTQDAQKFLV
ncbi:hypothetical protein O181_052358 [Austropuccinia psidii MF-1]|uniref:Uncharacterized protein n=1 Tax=Austropuccinia psidii MF-1 TaxID=1389203 RepID=A0A9Q3E2G2_9BASI|nr:hypothetical protein [Austropuccinia psidii MF-1]